ncbi:ATP-binding cassette domain-containing protein [Varibaculum cambriense]|uniref:ABC transporter ATP-binding protein n=1 Tax=Varibaculum cambriense TaxID=184870 RepID=UPI002912B7C3|nr:ATP-binding cassette domain-containing protein [Varibaculum cambriense]MDU7407317.1 ATP-binding cassette domain-containing protein [Varibaculum cambriense]
MNNNQLYQPGVPEEFHRYQKPRHAMPPAPASPPPGMPAVKPQDQQVPEKAFPARQSGNLLPGHAGVPQAASPVFSQPQPSAQPLPAVANSQTDPTQSQHHRADTSALPEKPSTAVPQPHISAPQNLQTSPGSPVVSLNNVYKIYRQGETEVRALDGVDLQIYFGQFTAIVGPSGSGKSTLLHCLAGLDSVTQGTVTVAGKDLAKMNDKTLTQFRRDHIGFVFQSFNLMPTLTALENIRLPQLLAGKKTSATWENQIIEILDLKDRLTHKPSELSGGQQQRVAVARALITKPALLVADEPTGNLDSASSKEVLKLLRNAASELGQSVVMVTHDPGAAAVADRVLIVKDGKITQELSHPTRGQLSQVI